MNNVVLRVLVVISAFGLAVAGAWYWYGNQPSTAAPMPAPQRTLGAPDQWGAWQVMTTQSPVAPLSFAQLADGKESILFFGFTHCPDVCPTALVEVSRALEDLPAEIRDSRQVLLVTLDPQRDTLDVMSDYTAFFGKRIYGVRIKEPQLAEMTKAFAVYYQQTPLAGELGYTVDHSAVMFRITAGGEVRVLTGYQEPGALREFIARP